MTFREAVKYEEDDPAHFRFALCTINSIETSIFRFLHAIVDNCLHFHTRKFGSETRVVPDRGLQGMRWNLYDTYSDLMSLYYLIRYTCIDSVTSRDGGTDYSIEFGYVSNNFLRSNRMLNTKYMYSHQIFPYRDEKLVEPIADDRYNNV